MEPARGSWIADGFADVHGERNDVVLHARFEFVNARDIHFAASTNRRRRIFGHEASFGKRLRGSQLDIEPLLEAIRIAPNLAHLFTRVTWDQSRSPAALRSNRTVSQMAWNQSNDTAF